MKNRLYPEFRDLSVLAEKTDGTLVRLLFKNDEPTVIKYINELINQKNNSFSDMDSYDVLTVNYNEIQELERLLEQEKSEFTKDYLNKAI